MSTSIERVTALYRWLVLLAVLVGPLACGDWDGLGDWSTPSECGPDQEQTIWGCHTPPPDGYASASSGYDFENCDQWDDFEDGGVNDPDDNENDTSSTAAPIAWETLYENQTVCRIDEDYYLLPLLMPGLDCVIEVEFERPLFSSIVAAIEAPAGNVVASQTGDGNSFMRIEWEIPRTYAGEVYVHVSHTSESAGSANYDLFALTSGDCGALRR